MQTVELQKDARRRSRRRAQQPSTLTRLLEAKYESDRGNYKAKHAIMRELMHAHPHHFRIDSRAGGVVGVTHQRTGFRMHLPRTALPDALAKHAAFPDDIMPWVLGIIDKAGSAVSAIRKACKGLPDGLGYGHVWYHPDTREVWASLGDWEDPKPWRQALAGVPGLAKVTIEAEANPPGWRRGEPWVRVKCAFNPVHATAQLMNLAEGPTNAPYGGPSPLAASLAGSLLGAGLGYGAGWLGEQFLPEEHFRPGHLRRTLALGGTALGAAPGLWWGAVAHRHHPEQKGWKAWLSGWPLRPQDQGPPAPPVPDEPRPDDYLKEGRFGPACRAALEKYGQPEPAYLRNIGSDFGIGGLTTVPMIPAQEFNYVVRSDPFTPRPLQAATTGLVDSAALQRRSPFVSPLDVGRIALGMGSGYASGMLVGKTLGALAGLRPETQKSLQRAGTWAGILANVVPLAFS